MQIHVTLQPRDMVYLKLCSMISVSRFTSTGQSFYWLQMAVFFTGNRTFHHTILRLLPGLGFVLELGFWFGLGLWLGQVS